MKVSVSVICLQVEGRNFSWADFQHCVLANCFFTKPLWSLDAILSQGMQYYSCPLLSEKKQVIMMVGQVQKSCKTIREDTARPGSRETFSKHVASVLFGST